ncbi:hypothetical protein DK59_2445 [Brucella abortus bv. 4 str. 292]|nr:hypothetical protein DK66_2850 [Brucella suis 1330]KFJ50988.1 hypothetical protein DK47_2928 [Brucella abortus 2308]KFJ59537.1 hypothetical protein DK59_2445 [Brucella abortus bv. 4 str. 292]
MVFDRGITHFPLPRWHSLSYLDCNQDDWSFG